MRNWSANGGEAQSLLTTIDSIRHAQQEAAEGSSGPPAA
jgi:hypothetical protein